MPPNQTLIKDYSTFGDLTQRDLYHRHRTQTIKQGAVENFFYHIDASDVKVGTALEKVTFDASSNVSTYEVYTKPTAGDLSLSANASMLQITTALTSVRSVLFEANGVSFGDLATSGNAAIGGTLGVTGNTSLTSVTASGDADITGTLDVTAATTLTTLGTSGLATMNAATVTGATSLASVTASGNAAITGTLGVTGNTSLTSVTASGDADITGTLDVTAATTLTTLDTSGLATMNAATVTGATNLNTVAASGNASITGTLGVTGNTSLGNVTASGDADITGTLDVTAATTLTTLDTSGLATMNAATVTGATNLNTVAASGNAAITGTLDVTGDTSLSNVAIVGTLGVTGNTTIDLGEGGSLAVTGTGNVNLGGNDLFSSGNVSFTGLTTVANLLLTGGSGFSGNVDMSNNSILNVATLTRDNVRVSLDNTSRTIALQTWTGASWDSSVTVAQDSVSVFKDLSATSSLTVDGDLTCTGSSVDFGGVGVTTNLTVFGNLEIKGATTNTRIESNIVQVGDLNVELGFLEVNTLANLNGAGFTVGGAGGSITARPELVYNHNLLAWQPNIDIVTKSSAATDIARMDTDGYFRSSTVADGNIFTQVDSTSVNFGNKWRFQHDVANDTVELQHYESSTWVPKFTYTA